MLFPAVFASSLLPFRLSSFDSFLCEIKSIKIIHKNNTFPTVLRTHFYFIRTRAVRKVSK